MKRLSAYMLPLTVAAFYLFLYLPIFVLIVFSFNNNAFTNAWLGFTTDWYTDLFTSTEVWYALKNSLLIATCSVVLSLTLGSVFIFFGSHGT